MPEIETEVKILNLTYVFRGLGALGDLVRFCDERASEVLNQGRGQDGTAPDSPPDDPEPTRAAQPLRGNSGDPCAP